MGVRRGGTDAVGGAVPPWLTVGLDGKAESDGVEMLGSGSGFGSVDWLADTLAGSSESSRTDRFI